MNTTIGLIISTLDDGIYRLKEMTGIAADEIIIVHQVSDDSKSEEYKNFYPAFDHSNAKIIMLKGKGLSVSRNNGLKDATADYLLICDDDGVFEENFISLLRKTILQFPEGDIFTFKTKTPDGRPYKKYSGTVQRHSKRSTAKVTSREILIKREWLVRSQIKFDERFGLGTEFPTGEEYIFLCDALKKGAVILFIPEFIVVHPFESSGKDFTPRLIRAKGAVFARTYGWMGFAVSLYFAIKKFDHYKKSVSFLQFVRLIHKGCYAFLKHG